MSSDSSLTNKWEETKQNAKETLGKTADKISDTAQRMKPESEKTFGEKISEKATDTKEKIKETGAEISDKISDTAQRMKPEDQKTFGEKISEKATEFKEKIKETGAEISDKISDTARRMKPDSEKTFGEKVSDTWEATKEKAQELGSKIGITEPPRSDLNQQTKETLGETADKVSDTAERMKPEDQKSLFEKAKETVTDTWEATKEKAHELGNKMGITTGSQESYGIFETGGETADKISDTAQRMKPESEKSLEEKAKEKISDIRSNIKEEGITPRE